MSFALHAAWTSLRAQRGRAALSAAGIAAAAVVLGSALSAARALSTGSDRAADRADTPTLIARFEDKRPADVQARIGALPNLAAASYRYERTGLRLAAGRHTTQQGVIEVVGPGRRGYAIVAGHDVGADGGVVLERGVASTWDLHPGDTIVVGRLGALRISGIAVGPDNVAFPLAKTARVYVSQAALLRRFGAPPGAGFPINTALLWARDASRSDVLVSAARQSSYGLRSLRFLTRSGVQALIGEAAGIVVALLVAFAIVAAGLAGVLLAAGAQSEVQRVLDRIGLQRALGVTPRDVVATHAARGAIVAAPALAIGLVTGALAAAGPVRDVLVSLNELAPSAAATAALLALLWAAGIALVAGCAAFPAWRATRRSPGALLRGGDLAPRGSGHTRSASLSALGAKLVAQRRARFATIVAVLGAAGGVVLLLLALASLLQALRADPATLGKRYQLTASLSPDRAADVARLPGVRAAQPRFSISATSGAALGSPLRVIAYPGDHSVLEAPPLAQGRRLRTAAEVEVGAGLADTLGLRPGSTLAVQPSGTPEVRLRVVGVVRALQDGGRVAYARPDRFEQAGVRLGGPIAIRLRAGADRKRIGNELRELGAQAQPVGGVTGDNGAFLGVLAALLRVVAGAVALVCALALVQALALTTSERRGAIATLRATGADSPALRRLLAGAAAAVIAPALAVAIAVEALVLAPLVSRLAAGYADLPLGASPAQIAALAGGLGAMGAAATWITAGRLGREPVIAGMREQT